MNRMLTQRVTLPDGSTIQGPLNPQIFGGAPSGIGTETLSLGMIVSRATTFVFAFAGLGLLIMLIMAGFTYLTSAGDSKKLEQGKQQLTNALIGFTIIFVAFWIVQIAGTILGYETITTMFK